MIRLKIEGQKHIGDTSEYRAETLLETYLATAKLTMGMKVSSKTAVMSFYAKNRRRLDPETADNIERGESKKRCPKIQDILELENAFATLRDKALLWFIASAPFRVSTIPKLKWNDLKSTNDKKIPFSMIIEAARLKGAGKGKYKGVKQVAFLHSLAVKKLEAYKQELSRKNYQISGNDPIFIAYRKKGHISALSSDCITNNFSTASLNAWHDLDQKRFSPHDFRGFVQSALENAGINKNIISPILSHKVSGVDRHYSKHEMSDFIEKFKTALPYLLPQTVQKVKAQQQKFNIKQELKVSLLETHIDKQHHKIETQNQRIQFLENKLTSNGLSINKMMFDLTERLQVIEVEEKKRKEEIKKKELAELMKPEKVENYT